MRPAVVLVQLAVNVVLVPPPSEALRHGVDDGEQKVENHKQQQPPKHPGQQVGRLEGGREETRWYMMKDYTTFSYSDPARPKHLGYYPWLYVGWEQDYS